MGILNNYYLSSFLWSTFAKVLNAVFSFISVPLLLGYFGKADYGIISIATACNGYMHLLDLGMNTGAVKFFSQWKAEGNTSLSLRVAHTNITFYFIIAIIYAVLLIALAIWGEPLFSIDHEQFLVLRKCLYVLAIMSVLSWSATPFNQLLIADKQMVYTQQVQCFQILLKILLVVFVLLRHLTLLEYFAGLTLIISILTIPYSIRCVKSKLIDNLLPGFHWKDFRVVLTFSLSIFALSLFQTTATQSRPILLSMFALNGANAVTDFRVIESFPALIITIGGTFSSIFLPQASEMVAKKDQKAIETFAYDWTLLTTVLANVLCVPFMLCAKEVLIAYVGDEYANLSIWLIIWCVSVLLQIHTTPGNSLVLASGKTKLLVICTAVFCVISMGINILLAKKIGVGSAVIGYAIYVLLVIGMYYIVFYRRLLNLSRLRMLKSFLIPTVLSIMILILTSLIPLNPQWFTSLNSRLANLLTCIIKTIIWLVPYIVLLKTLKVFDLKTIKRYDDMSR